MFQRCSSQDTIFKNSKPISNSSFHRLQYFKGMNPLQLKIQEQRFRKLLLSFHSFSYHLHEFEGYFHPYFEQSKIISHIINHDILYLKNILDDFQDCMISAWPLPNTLDYKQSCSTLQNLKKILHKIYKAITIKEYPIPFLQERLCLIPPNHNPMNCQCINPLDFWITYDLYKPAIHIPIPKARRKSI